MNWVEIITGNIFYYWPWIVGIVVIGCAVAWFLWKLGTIRGT